MKKKLTVSAKSAGAMHHKEILSLKKTMKDYKEERRAQWKTFKNKMNSDIDKIKKSIDKLINHEVK